MYGGSPIAAGLEALAAEPEDMGLRLSPGMVEGGVSSALILVCEGWPLATVGREDEDNGPPNFAVRVFTGNSRGPGRLLVAVLLRVKLEAFRLEG